MRLFSKIAIGIAAAAVFVVVVFIAAVSYYFYYPASTTEDTEVVFVVTEGESLNDIADHLIEGGLLRRESREALKFYVEIRGFGTNVQAGQYALKATMSPVEIGRTFVARAALDDSLVVLIPEGFRIDEIEARFESLGNPVEFSALKIRDFSSEFAFLKDAPEGASLEGFLFPDTYRFKPASPAETVAERLLSNFNEKFTEELRQETKARGHGIYEIVTMASLIEKEVSGFGDQRMVSGVLWKRFEVGMALQVDATVAFITGKRTTRLTLEDLKTPSPYNTYLHPGLPPGPIGNPGASALEAAVRPAENPYWYYLSTPEGETIFSRTLEEHNAAKQKYLR